jgi:putative polyketide hydroxylase
MQDSQIPVLIIGAGPAGLTSALFLARSGVKTLLVEKHNSTSLHPRARGLNVRTMEIFRTVGLEETVLKVGAALAKSRYMLFVETLAGQEIRRVPDEELMAGGELLAEFSPAVFSQCAQDELEPLLLNEARRFGAEVRFGTEFVALEQTEEAVSVTLRQRNSGKVEMLECQYIIAADGASSAVRQSLKLEMQGLGPGDVADDGRGSLGDYINIYFEADLTALVQERWFGICFIENPRLEAVLLPVNNRDRWLLNIAYHPSQTKPADFTPTRCLELVQVALGTDQLSIKILSILPWQAAARLVVEQMQAGRVFLTGDAAHQMPPAGGFGLNTAVQDAHNLAWKLAAVIQSGVSPKLLETYQSERWVVAQAVVGQAVADLTAPTPDYLPVAPANNENENGANSEPDWGENQGWQEQDHEAALLEQLRLILGYRYNSPAIIAEPGKSEQPERFKLAGETGTRAPHIWLKRAGERFSTLDLLDYNWVLLVGSQGQSWLEAVEKLNNRLNFRLKIYQIGGESEVSEIIPGSWATAYGVSPGGSVLVRPDQFIAWRTTELAQDQSAYSVLAMVLDKLMAGLLADVN